jgi:hypothetical protein
MFIKWQNPAATRRSAVEKISKIRSFSSARRSAFCPLLPPDYQFLNKPVKFAHNFNCLKIGSVHQMYKVSKSKIVSSALISVWHSVG